MGTTIPHSKAGLGHVHPIINWRFNLSAELDAFAEVTAQDFHKVAFVAETQGYYTPVEIDAGSGEVTWVQLNGSGGGGGGGGATNIGVVQNATTATVTSSTGSDGTITAATSSIAGLMLPAQVDKLEAVPVNLTEFTQDTVASFLVAGSNITLTYNDVANTLTIASSGGGGGGATNLSYTASPSNGVVVSDTGTDATITLADGTNAGLMAPVQHTKLAGIATGATANSTDAFLLDRANHTGTQAQSTIVNLTSDLAGKQATLVSGTNIKTVNGNSLLGSGDITISGGATDLALGAITSSTVEITSSTGADVVIPAVTATTAGVMTQAQLLTMQGKQDALPNFTTQRILFGNGTNVPVTSSNLTYNSSTDVLTLGASAQLIWNAATVDTIAGWNGSRQLVSLNTGTYPNLTELARVKGVTSAIQTQLDAKMAGLEVVKNSGSVVGTRKQINFIEGSNVTLTVADDAGNNQVDVTIAASGGGAPTPGSVASYFWDFPGGTIDFEGGAFAGIASGNGTTAATQAEEAGAFGTRFISCSATANSGAYFNPVVGGGNGYWLVAGTASMCKFRLKFPATLNATTKARFGFQGAFNTSDETHEVSFVVDAGNIVGRCRNAGSQTSTTALGSITTDVWMGFKIEYTSTACVFRVYNAAGTLLATETLTSNIPVNINKAPGIIATNSGTTPGKILGIDYFYGETSITSRAF